MRVCSIAYLPSETDARFNTVEFVENLAANPPVGELLLFSDHPQPTAERAGLKVIRLQKNFDTIPTLQNARIQRPGTADMVENKAAINNLIFLTAIRICMREGFSHALYLEQDCRVKNHAEPWDKRLFKEFFEHPRHLLMAGSVVCYNPYNHTLESALRFERFVEESKAAGRRNPIPVYGWMSAASGQGALAFVNGAGGIYSVEGLKLLFPELAENNDIGLAASIWAYDFAIGLRLWDQFQADVYNLIAYLPSLYSGYGNVLNSEADRLQMLEDWAAVTHQHKGKK